MDKLFLGLINMSITSTYVILFIIGARLFLKKAPKIFSYGLWSIAFLRLIFPFSFESVFSLIQINTKTIPENIIYTPTPQIQSGIRIVDGTVNRLMPASPPIGASINPIQIHIFIGSTVWAVGLVALLIYSIVTTIRLSKNLRSATFLCDNIYQTDNIKTPFVFGLIRPKIYLPYNLSKTEETYIIRHEQTHIKRKDNIIKFVAFLIVCIHWFNPFVWLAFYLMGEDMELSCDESVIREMGYSIKKDYSNSLLSLSVGKKIIGGSPIAFGETNTKGRIKNILNYKRPKFWVVIIALAVVIGLAVGLLSNPADNLRQKDLVDVPNIIIGQSAKFTEKEIMDAIYTVKNDFAFPAATLTKILYDEEKSDSLINGYINHGRGLENGVKPENVIILLSEFYVDGSGDNPVLNPNSTYTDFQWILIRDNKESNWIIDDRGY